MERERVRVKGGGGREIYTCGSMEEEGGRERGMEVWRNRGSDGGRRESD